MSENWKDKLRGGFAYMTAPFAVHPNDEERAGAMLDLVKQEGVTLDDVLQEARAYLLEKKVKQEYIEEQLDRVRAFCKSLNR